MTKQLKNSIIITTIAVIALVYGITKFNASAATISLDLQGLKIVGGDGNYLTPTDGKYYINSTPFSVELNWQIDPENPLTENQIIECADNEKVTVGRLELENMTSTDGSVILFEGGSVDYYNGSINCRHNSNTSDVETFEVLIDRTAPQNGTLGLGNGNGVDFDVTVKPDPNPEFSVESTPATITFSAQMFDNESGIKNCSTEFFDQDNNRLQLTENTPQPNSAGIYEDFYTFGVGDIGLKRVSITCENNVGTAISILRYFNLVSGSSSGDTKFPDVTISVSAIDRITSEKEEIQNNGNVDGSKIIRIFYGAKDDSKINTFEITKNDSPSSDVDEGIVIIPALDPSKADTYSPTLYNGNYTFTLSATDEYGNSNEATFSFTVINGIDRPTKTPTTVELFIEKVYEGSDSDPFARAEITTTNSKDNTEKTYTSYIYCDSVTVDYIKLQNGIHEALFSGSSGQDQNACRLEVWKDSGGLSKPIMTFTLDPEAPAPDYSQSYGRYRYPYGLYFSLDREDIYDSNISMGKVYYQADGKDGLETLFSDVYCQGLQAIDTNQQSGKVSLLAKIAQGNGQIICNNSAFDEIEGALILATVHFVDDVTIPEKGVGMMFGNKNFSFSQINEIIAKLQIESPLK